MTMTSWRAREAREIDQGAIFLFVELSRRGLLNLLLGLLSLIGPRTMAVMTGAPGDDEDIGSCVITLIL